MAMARELKHAIEWGAVPAKPILLRTRNDEALTLRERGKLSEKHGCQLLISIHTNAYHTDELRGGLVFHMPEDRIGEAVGSVVARCLPNPLYRRSSYSIAATDRPTMDDDWLQAPRNVLENHTMPAILVELGYMTNPVDLAVLCSPAGRNGLVLAMMAGIVEFQRLSLTL
jgi:N-acetylmuramoyl-L-alanine amidase